MCETKREKTIILWFGVCMRGPCRGIECWKCYVDVYNKQCKVCNLDLVFSVEWGRLLDSYLADQYLMEC